MRITLGLIVTISVLFASALLFAGSPGHDLQAGGHRTMIAIPQSIQAEHKAIHAALTEATKAPGRVGIAARELAAVLGPHFKREDEIALPPLGLLGPLAAGETPAGMKEALAMSDALRKELPRMLEEHKHIRAATERLRTIAREEQDTVHAQFAEQLAAHATSEEEVLYPAAILVGDIIRARMSK
jgi:hypothetical protein